MKTKYSLGLLAVIILTAGLAFAQEQSPPSPPDQTFENTFSFFVDGGGFLGIFAEDITRENMARYRLSQPRGVGVTQVMKESPAEKAGIRKDDVILRFDGENVTSARKLNRLVSEMAPDHAVRITISRGGSEQELTATIGKRTESSTAQNLLSREPRIWRWEGPLIGRDNFPTNEDGFRFFLGNSRRIGVSTMELTKQLAEFFGIADGRGVLVTSVAADSPAAKAGVKAGDVITAVDGEAIDSPGDLARAINRKKDGEVSLTVFRNKSQQTIRVTPRDGGSTGTLQRADGGRRIVIPRIEIPTPDVDITMPSIHIPAIPPINIQMPRVRVAPRFRRSRSVYGPI